MLSIVIPGVECFDESRQEFITVGERTLELEHSLASLSKWESIWEIPFLSTTEKTAEQTLNYILCMAKDPTFPPEALKNLSPDNAKSINEYINAKMSATWFGKTSDGRRGTEIITAEIIYYWMITLNIPIEFENWHLNRLFTLIKVLNEKNAPKKKMGRREAMAQQRALNEQRRQQMGTQG